MSVAYEGCYPFNPQEDGRSSLGRQTHFFEGSLFGVVSLPWPFVELLRLVEGQPELKDNPAVQYKMSN